MALLFSILLAALSSPGNDAIPDGVLYRASPAPLAKLVPLAGHWSTPSGDVQLVIRPERAGWLAISFPEEASKLRAPATIHGRHLYISVDGCAIFAFFKDVVCRYKEMPCYLPFMAHHLPDDTMDFLLPDIARIRRDNPWLRPPPAAGSDACDGVFFSMSKRDQRRLVIVVDRNAVSLTGGSPLHRQ